MTSCLKFSVRPFMAQVECTRARGIHSRVSGKSNAQLDATCTCLGFRTHSLVVNWRLTWHHSLPCSYWRPILRLLWYTSLWELVFILALAWVDFLPWFGTSTSPADLRAQLAATLYCSLGMNADGDAWGSLTSKGNIGVGCTSTTAAAAWLTSLGYVISYVGGAALNRERCDVANGRNFMLYCAHDLANIVKSNLHLQCHVQLYFICICDHGHFYK